VIAAAFGLGACAVALAVLLRAERRHEQARFDAELRMHGDCRAVVSELACLAGRHDNKRRRCAVCDKPKRIQ
jgi:hypothetical protein